MFLLLKYYNYKCAMIFFFIHEILYRIYKAYGQWESAKMADLVKLWFHTL